MLKEKFKKSISLAIEKIISRKFLIWAIATHMVYFGFLQSSDWINISMLYLGAQAVIDYKQPQKTETESELK